MTQRGSAQWIHLLVGILLFAVWSGRRGPAR